MYGKDFIDRFKTKLERDDTFKDFAELRADVTAVCIDVLFSPHPPVETFGEACKKLFVGRMLDAPTGAAAHGKLERRLRILDIQDRMLDEALRFYAALDAFIDTVDEEKRLAADGGAAPNGLKIT